MHVNAGTKFDSVSWWLGGRAGRGSIWIICTLYTCFQCCVQVAITSKWFAWGGGWHVQQKVTVTYSTPAVPSQTEASAVLVSPWSTSQSMAGALVPGCAGAVHCLFIAFWSHSSFPLGGCGAHRLGWALWLRHCGVEPQLLDKLCFPI